MARYIPHALRQMEKRNISMADVELVLADPDYDHESGTADRWCYTKNIGDRRIQVVVEANDHDLVVTVYDRLEQS